MILHVFIVFFCTLFTLTAAEREILFQNGVHLKMTPTEPILWTIDCGDATEIDNNFLCFAQESNTTIKHIKLIGKNLRKIGNNFLGYCQGLTLIEFESLENVTIIGDNFLSNCTNLKQINLHPFINVQKIGKRFLNACTSLISIDLSAFKNLHTLDECFLSFCISLTELDLSALENARSVGGHFLYGTSRLKRKKRLNNHSFKKLHHSVTNFNLINYFGQHLL